MKYALFEFTEDDSVEVGDVSCIQDIDKYEKDLNDVVNKNVMVKWPTSTSGTKFGSYEATVVAVNDSKLKLIDKRNKLVKGESIVTDIESAGREKRKKYPSTRITSMRRVSSISSSDSESESSEEETTQKAKKKRNANNVTDKKNNMSVQQGTSLARELRQQLQTKSNEIEQAAEMSSDDRDNIPATARLQDEMAKNREQQQSIAHLKIQIKKERDEKERLRSQLLFLEGVPDFIKTFKHFIGEMKGNRPKGNRKLTAAEVASDVVVVHEAFPPVDHEQDEEEVELSSNVKVKKKLLLRCNSSDPRKLTSDLMVLLFGREVLASHSLTGGKNTKGFAKPALSKTKVEAIIAYVTTKFQDATPDMLKLVMTNKLSNESKLQRRKEVAPAPAHPDQE